MTDSLAPVPAGKPPNRTKHIGLSIEETAIAAVEVILERQRRAFLDQTRDMLVQAMDRVVPEHGVPLTEQLRTTLLQTLEQVRREQLTPFLEQTRVTILATVAKVMQQHLQPLLDQLRETLLQAADEMQKQQLDPLLARTREFLLRTVDDLWGRYTTLLADPVKKMPLALLSSLKATLTQPVQDFVYKHVPTYTEWVGRRILNFTVAATLFCVAIVFVCLGTAQALDALGVPSWCAFLGVGLAALLFGVLFYLRWMKFGKQVEAMLEPPLKEFAVQPGRKIRGMIPDQLEKAYVAVCFFLDLEVVEQPQLSSCIAGLTLEKAWTARKLIGRSSSLLEGRSHEHAHAHRHAVGPDPGIVRRGAGAC